MTVGYTFTAGGSMPPALPEWFEAPLAEVSEPSFALDLTSPMPPVVRARLHRPMLTRGAPEAGTVSTMTGGTPRDWYDMVVHTRQVTPSTPLDLQPAGSPRIGASADGRSRE